MSSGCLLRQPSDSILLSSAVSSEKSPGRARERRRLADPSGDGSSCPVMAAPFTLSLTSTLALTPSRERALSHSHTLVHCHSHAFVHTRTGMSTQGQHACK